ncbi:MAG: hypothetical protein ACYST6_20765 [Planctomycetota bacterium]
MPTQAQSVLNRKLDKPAYKAAISPGSPIPPESTVNWQLTTVNSLLSSTLVENQILPPKSKPKQSQTNPIRPPFFAHQGTPKPKRTQTNPKQTQFFARQGLSKPKRTQTNPKQTQPVVSLSNLSIVSLSNLFITAKPACHGEVLYEAGVAKPEQTQFRKEKNAAAFDDQPLAGQVLAGFLALGAF